MILLSNLKNTHRPRKQVQRVGRGIGSKRGKTCCRGGKGDKARRGYKSMPGKEGGQLPLYRKLPTKGFSSARFKKDVYAVNLSKLNDLFEDGEIVTLESLRQKGCGPREVSGGLKILGDGEITKKVTIHAAAFSKRALEKLQQASIPFHVLATAVRSRS